ncbi:hypothetical protein ACLBPT_28605, partial [Klebsiella pneumoniae]
APPVLFLWDGETIPLHHESEPDLHRIDVVVSRLRHKARQQGIHLPVRAIFGKGLAFIS